MKMLSHLTIAISISLYRLCTAVRVVLCSPPRTLTNTAFVRTAHHVFATLSSNMCSNYCSKAVNHLADRVMERTTCSLGGCGDY
ncbi:hypothetical protein DENSPDRAFT_127649 [Dentipellis sp. KUC8613]|nr:hypothetical protein DENSPDRAFT_127649 [Dentipellis sp. KUC8613]